MEITVCGKNILRFYRHLIMRIDYKTAVKGASLKPGCHLRRIKKNNIDEEIGTVGSTVTTPNLCRLIRANPHRCEGFILYNQQDHPVGSIWVMYRGGNDLEYRIRNTEAYIFGVYVSPECRGQGWARVMIARLMRYLHYRKKIEYADLAVAYTNTSAIRAYQKAGFRKIGSKEFARFLKVNIPYHTL